MAPSSVYAVRRVLQSPYETVRRHILRLESRGYCHRTGDGVLADLRVFGTPEIIRSRAMAWEKTEALRDELVALGVSVAQLPAHPTDRMKETNCRLAVEFLLNMIPAATGGTGLDLTPLLIFLTVHRENLRHLDIGMPEHRRILGERGSPFDDKVRTPVSTYRVAAALKLPYETTRRHALVLVEHGLCSRDSSGRLMVTAEAARSPGVSSATRAVWQLTRSYLDAVSRLSDERPQAALSA